MPAEKESPRNLPESRVQGQRFLELFDQHGNDYATFAEFCDAFGLSYGYFRKLRSQNETFNAACEAILARGCSTRPPKSRAPGLARDRWPSLPLWQGIFVERYRETIDRVEAARMVGRYLVEIESVIEREPVFKLAVETVEREIQVRAEDALKRSAVKGTGNTKQFLAASGSSLGQKRPTGPARDPAAARGARFAELLAAHEQRGVSDTAPEVEEPTAPLAAENEHELDPETIDELANQEPPLAGETPEETGSELATA